MDEFHLDRFVIAQDAGGDYTRAVAELRHGRKASHWMWYVFPQIAGLGYSAISRQYAISSLAEAQAYLAHSVLGPRLTEVSTILLGLAGVSADHVFGSVDAQKLRSSMTLFDRATESELVFGRVLEAYFDGIPDEATLERIAPN